MTGAADVQRAREHLANDTAPMTLVASLRGELREFERQLHQAWEDRDAAERRVAELEEALRDLMGAVDALCDWDAAGDRDDEHLPDHGRSAVELSLQRAREVLAAAGSAGEEADRA